VRLNAHSRAQAHRSSSHCARLAPRAPLGSADGKHGCDACGGDKLKRPAPARAARGATRRLYSLELRISRGLLRGLLGGLSSLALASLAPDALSRQARVVLGRCSKEHVAASAEQLELGRVWASSACFCFCKRSLELGHLAAVC
jgi:hypothetical protein